MYTEELTFILGRGKLLGLVHAKGLPCLHNRATEFRDFASRSKDSFVLSFPGTNSFFNLWHYNAGFRFSRIRLRLFLLHKHKDKRVLQSSKHYKGQEAEIYIHSSNIYIPPKLSGYIIAK